MYIGCSPDSERPEPVNLAFMLLCSLTYSILYLLCVLLIYQAAGKCLHHSLSIVQSPSSTYYSSSSRAPRGSLALH